MTWKKYRNKLKRYYLKQGLEFKVACYAAKHELHLALKHYGWAYVGEWQHGCGGKYLYVKHLNSNWHYYMITTYEDSELGYNECVNKSGVAQKSAKEALLRQIRNDDYWSNDDSWEDVLKD